MLSKPRYVKLSMLNKPRYLADTIDVGLTEVLILQTEVRNTIDIDAEQTEVCNTFDAEQVQVIGNFM